MNPDWVQVATAIFGIAGWLLYFRADRYRRDVLTDLLGVVYDHDLDEGDLRRSLGYSDVDNRLQRWNNDDSQ